MTNQLTKNERKGRRHENEARRILNMCYRFGSRVTDTASPDGRTDLFHCADLIAVRAGWPVKFVQVKTNEGPPGGHSWATTFVDNEYTQFEYWCRYDRQGWEIHAFLPDEGGHGGAFEKVLELETSLDKTEARDRYSQYLEDRWGLCFEEGSEGFVKVADTCGGPD